MPLALTFTMIGLLLALLVGDVVGVVTADPIPKWRGTLSPGSVEPDLLRRIGGEMPRRENIVVDAEGRVKWAVVRVLNPPDRRPNAPPVPVDAEVKGLTLRPHVILARTGQNVIFRNADPVAHCLQGGAHFNVGIPPGRSYERAFAKPEIVRVKDHVYPWMEAWVVVDDHPFVGVTDEKGAFRLRGLPPGRYSLEVWHERLAGARVDVDVGEGETTAPDLVLKGTKP